MEPLPPPTSARGPVAWVREHLFSGPLNICSRSCCRYLLYVVIPPLVRFLFIDAVWTGTDRDACLDTEQRHCRRRLLGVHLGQAQPTSSTAPIRSTERWRVNVFFALLAIGIVWLLWPEGAAARPRRDVLLHRLPDRLVLPAHGRDLARPVDRSHDILWGGILVTLLVARRSASWSRCRSASFWRSAGARSCRSCGSPQVIFIEFVRGVPLITVLFMANTMLPLFLPGDMQPRPAAAAAHRHRALRLRLHGRGGARRPAGACRRASMKARCRWGSTIAQMMRLDHPAAGPADHDPRHRQHLHRPVQGHHRSSRSSASSTS